MKIDIACIDTDKPLYGFWKYDSVPFVLGGNIKSITDDDKITVEGYTGCKFTPLVITTKENGEKIQKIIDEAAKAYNDTMHEALVTLTQTVNKAFDDYKVGDKND